MTWHHDSLQADLADHLRKTSERLVYENMQIGPMGSPRPDVYTIHKSYSRPRPMSYEIKVSVSDFRSDVTSGKWDKYLEFSAGVIFAVPRGLIKRADLPRGAGLIVRSDKGWRVTKGPTLHPVTLGQNICLKLLFEGNGNFKDVFRDSWRRETLERHWRTKAKLEIGDRYGRKVAEYLSRADRTDEQLDDRLTKANEAVDRAKRLLSDLCDALGLEGRKRDPAHARWAIETKIRDLRDDHMVEDLRNKVRHLTRLFEEIASNPLIKPTEVRAND